MSNANENFIMLPTVDICFKELMKNENVRRGFIAALMGVPPEKIRRTVLKDGTLPPEYGTDKLGLLDVKVILDNGVQIDIEMQVAFFAHWDARVLFYLSRMISGQLGKGEAYGELKNYRKKWRMRISSSAGCVFWAGKTERSWNAWQRQICISKRLIRI